MKIDRSILAVALGLASVSLASAQQFVYLTGSTAARDAVYNTVMNGTAGGFDSTPAFIGYGNSTAGNCSYMEFLGNISGVQTILTCHWSGSEAGIADVSGSTVEQFAEDSVGSFPAPGTANAVANSGNPSSTVGHTVDFAQADNDLPYSYTFPSSATALNDNLVIPFVFVKTTTTLADANLITDVNYDNFKAIAQGGSLASLFTGNPADTSYYIYLAGRDHFSGTRANTFGDTGWGIKKSPTQIELDSAGNMLDPNSDGSYTTSEGQSSGGTLAKSLVNTTASIDQINTGTAGFVAIAYLGLADDATAEGSPINATRLTYCGVSYSIANVESGLYKFWGYEFTMTRSGINSVASGIASKVVANLKNNTSSFEIPVTSMTVKRSGPTGYVVHN